MAVLKPRYLVQGLPGHPSHPPFTDATIGIYTFAVAAAVLSKLGIADKAFAQAWWLALIVGLIVSVATAGTGFLDWLQISRGTPLWRTATLHMVAMVTATVLFAITAGAGHPSYVDAEISTGPFILTLIGFGMLTIGGWLGGAIVFVYGMRVLNLVEEPAARAAAPVPHEEKVEAEKT
jgi:uncharacterized membrane protein